MNTKFYDNVATIWVLWPKPENPLKYSDLLVYSWTAYYLAYHEEMPSQHKIAKTTCLSINTVAASLKRLGKDGFVAESKPVPRPEMFWPADSSTSHWFYQSAFWKTLLPSGESPLSLIDTMVFSHLLHLHFFNDNKAKSNIYLGNAIGLDARTVGQSREMLKTYYLFDDANGNMQVPSALTGLQMMWFRGKGSKPAESSVITTFEPDPEKVLAIYKDGLKRETSANDDQTGIALAQAPVYNEEQVEVLGINVEHHLKAIGAKITPQDNLVREVFLALNHKHKNWRKSKDWKALVEQEYRRITDGQGH